MPEGEYRTGEPTKRPCCEQARAEVLAACIYATCALCRTEKPYLMWFGGKNWKGRYQAWVHDVKLEGRVEVQTCPADAMHSLQPAAKDLEELLREAGLKGRIAQLEAMKGEDAGGMWFPDPGKPTVNNRIAELKAELEKARASEGEESTGS